MKPIKDIRRAVTIVKGVLIPIFKHFMSVPEEMTLLHWHVAAAENDEDLQVVWKALHKAHWSYAKSLDLPPFEVYAAECKCANCRRISRKLKYINSRMLELNEERMEINADIADLNEYRKEVMHEA